MLNKQEASKKEQISTHIAIIVGHLIIIFGFYIFNKNVDLLVLGIFFGSFNAGMACLFYNTYGKYES